MTNNKGQVLVVFVLLLPIFFMLLALIIDSGYLFIEKRKVDYSLKYAIEYGLENIELENSSLNNKLKVVINKNIKDIDTLNITIKDDSIKIKLIKKQGSIFGMIFSKYSYGIESEYYGYIDNGKIVVRKE